MNQNQFSDGLRIVLLIPFFLLSFWPNLIRNDLPRMFEICENGLDDDKDGLIDLNDPDCKCSIIEPISLIPNPSFEEMDCCPYNRSQLDCASSWIQASEPTTDFIHTCDWLGWDEFPAPFPFPDGQGIMGFRDGRITQGGVAESDWKEYAGACLLSPLLADSLYRFEFDVGFVNSLRSPPINISFFGTTNCDNLPFGKGNDAFGCPTNGPGWIKLGSTNVSGGSGNKWVKANIEVVPLDDIYAIAIGPDCPHVMASVSIYYFFDNLLLADFASFALKIKEESHPCSESYTLQVPYNKNFDYQWFKDGMGLIGEYSYLLEADYGEGMYQVRIDDGQSCRVSAGFDHKIPFLTNLDSKTICKDESYVFGNRILKESGDYQETFKSVNNCDSIVFLTLKVLGTVYDTTSAKIFEGEKFNYEGKTYIDEGNYPIELVSSIGCDSLVNLHLEFFHIYIPNVFSPNEDGINDVFTVFGEENLIQSFDFTIFDRWGEKVYSGKEWDGTHNGSFVQNGVFTYLIKFVLNDGNEKLFSGSITVLE